MILLSVPRVRALKFFLQKSFWMFSTIESYLIAPRSTLGHWPWGSIVHPLFIYHWVFLISVNLVTWLATRLATRAMSNALVGFYLGTFWFQVKKLCNCATLLQYISSNASHKIFTHQPNNPLIHFRNTPQLWKPSQQYKRTFSSVLIYKVDEIWFSVILIFQENEFNKSDHTENWID